LSFLNTDASKRAIQDLGEAVSVKHYAGDQVYAADQSVSRSSTTTTTKAQIKDPSKQDIDTGENFVSINDKKFIFFKGIDLDVGDNITVTRTSIEYNVKLVSNKDKQGLKTKTVAFASLVK